ncbi:MAG TPA: polyprenyl synthetase family protein [Acidimicrobiales bacterium]|nr:polyprenyl synthetase family protein [Acidimicrobiales bacterium]
MTSSISLPEKEPVITVSSSSPLLALPTMASDIERVNEELRSSVQSDDSFLTEVAIHLINAGGKRVRPALSIATSLLSKNEPESVDLDVIRGGVAVELVHQGSLYHDDVMDGAKTRRNVESVNARWGNREAILAGDFLLARASGIAADLGTEVAGLLASTIASLCEGQVLELQNTFNIDRTEDSYFQSISGKTAVLLATAARVGALVADHPRDLIEAVTSFGQNYGMAFQIIDDVLDLIATDAQLGKPAGNDLIEGVYTLPVIRALAGSNGEELRDLLDGSLDKASRDQAISIIRSADALPSTVETAVYYTNQARNALNDLAPTPAANTLHMTCDLLLEQTNLASR